MNPSAAPLTSNYEQDTVSNEIECLWESREPTPSLYECCKSAENSGGR